MTGHGRRARWNWIRMGGEGGAKGSPFEQLDVSEIGAFIRWKERPVMSRSLETASLDRDINWLRHRSRGLSKKVTNEMRQCSSRTPRAQRAGCHNNEESNLTSGIPKKLRLLFFRGRKRMSCWLRIDGEVEGGSKRQVPANQRCNREGLRIRNRSLIMRAPTQSVQVG
jgi:hypothetical protein